MGRKRNSKQYEETEVEDGGVSGLKAETVRTIGAIVSFVVALFFLLAAFDLSGVVGSTIYGWLSTFFGVGYFLLVVVCTLIGIVLLRSLERSFSWIHTTGAVTLFVSGLGLVGLLMEGNGGVVGGWIASPLEYFLDLYVSLLVLTALVVISILVLFNTSVQLDHISALWSWLKRPVISRDDVTESDEDTEHEGDEDTEEEGSDEFEPEQSDEADEESDDGAEHTAKKRGVLSGVAARLTGSSSSKAKEDELETQLHSKGFVYEYTPPPLSILKTDSGKPSVGDVKANANIIKRALANFGIQVEMDEISVGPSVTRYALKPAEGIKLSRIVGLQNDLALALAAHPLRIEAPIPGKSLVGIEIPNKTKSTVGLGTLMGSSEFTSSPHPLLVALGKSVSGVAHFANVAKMPHLLIAGATGSGKSVTIHSLITSLLYRNSPEHLRFIMVDPKRVELTLYNKIPHLLTPVITSPKEAIKALKWAAKEMDRRYDILEAEMVRDISSYHSKVLNPAREKLKKQQAKDPDTSADDLPEALPYIVVIIDELADIMATYPRELEASIVRLAQMSRAVGIHLMLSTQRPSVNVITGLIKANIPVRIALQVASQIDSRTILDASGAERLLGSGDLLYLSSEMSKPQRIQSAFITEEEVKKVVDHLKKNYAGEITSDLDVATDGDPNSLFESLSEDEDDEDEDELYEDAREVVIQAGKASTSFLQRKFKIGYNRGARLMDMLEARGVIGPADGAKPRQVFERPPSNDYGETPTPSEDTDHDQT